MAKYRRRRFYRRKAGKWAPNIQEVGGTIVATPSTWFETETIMSNPTQQNTYVSQTYTVKNIEINFNIEYEGGSTYGADIEGITAYVMFVPQGMNITDGYNLQHPEYIMAYKYLGSPSIEISRVDQNTAAQVGQQYQPHRIKTRLSRKLQTGDSVVLFIKGVNQIQTTINLRLSGLIRWWTKAN